jgi:hypothetical protein
LFALRANEPTQTMEESQKLALRAAVLANDFVSDLAFYELVEHGLTAVMGIIREAQAIIPKIATGNAEDFCI